MKLSPKNAGVLCCSAGVLSACLAGNANAGEVENTELTSAGIFACVTEAPEFADTADKTGTMESTRKTPDPNVVENAAGQYGGTGPFETGGETNAVAGCFIYTKNAGSYVAPSLNGNDAYWSFVGPGPTQMLAIVSPKTSGTYQGRTLMALVPME